MTSSGPGEPGDGAGDGNDAPRTPPPRPWTPEPWLEVTPGPSAPGEAPGEPPTGPPAGPSAGGPVGPRPGPPEAWQPRPYPQLLRGPGYRWWRPLVSLAAGLVAVVVVVGVIVAGTAACYAVLAMSGGSQEALDDDAWTTSPSGLLITNLVLAALIPATMAAVRVGFGWPPRWLVSVEGRLRPGWLGTCAVIGVLVLVVPSLGLVLVGEDVTRWTPEPRWPVLVAVILLTTPLQAAGEEFLFRGWLPQAIGSWFANPVASGLAGAAVSCSLFALAHGEQNPWLFGDRFAFGAVACWLVWRTGGLEASVALHAVNNLTAFGITIAQGKLTEAVNVTEADPVTVAVDVATLVITALIVDAVAQRRRITRLFVPPLPGGPA